MNNPGKNFYHHLYLTTPDQAPLPLLLTPLAHHNDALGYLAMVVYATPITANQTQQLPDLGKLIANAAVRAHVIEDAVAARDRLVNMLLTSPVDETFAAQFRLQNAVLPSSMVIVQATPAHQQTMEALKEQLKYLATPMFTQFLVTLHQHQCLALITVDLQTYHSGHFHEQARPAGAACRLPADCF